jgi:hypothetical protein
MILYKQKKQVKKLIWIYNQNLFQRGKKLVETEHMKKKIKKKNAETPRKKKRKETLVFCTAFEPSGHVHMLSPAQCT